MGIVYIAEATSVETPSGQMCQKRGSFVLAACIAQGSLG